jgi:hypothetical protein
VINLTKVYTTITDNYGVKKEFEVIEIGRRWEKSTEVTIKNSKGELQTFFTNRGNVYRYMD